jgi:hypothetical protein
MPTATTPKYATIRTRGAVAPSSPFDIAVDCKFADMPMLERVTVAEQAFQEQLGLGGRGNARRRDAIVEGASPGIGILA